MKKENTRLLVKKEERLGEVHLSNEGYKMTVVEYINNEDCTVQFENGVLVKHKEYSKILKGQISNPLHLSVHEIGYVGVGEYCTTIDGKLNKIYNTWYGMIRRCYSEKYHKKSPTYSDCLVDERWHNFQIFGKWFEENYVEGFSLDKDILIKGNKIYSPETCCFVPQEINNLIIKNNKKRGIYPIGVNRKENKFQATINISGKPKYLGIFNTPEDAFKAYKEAKEQEIKRLAKKWRLFITDECYEALVKYQVEITD